MEPNRNPLSSALWIWSNFKLLSLFSAAILISAMAEAGLTFQVIKSFESSTNDGSSPFAGVIEGSVASLYGTTSYGGANDYGTVFKVNKDGSGYEVLHNFGFGKGTGDGGGPNARLLEGRDGSLYGTTVGGGTNGSGTVFKLSKDGSNYAVLYNFGSRIDDGSFPQSELIQGSDGALYGTTGSGGETNQHGGTVFKLNTDGSGYQILHRFGTTLVGDAQHPNSGLLEASDGLLYGLSYDGGTNNNGAVFALNKDGSGYRVLHSLVGSDGNKSWSNLIEGNDGALYSTTSNGGLYGNGTIFKVAKDGTGFQVLHQFSSTDGLYPYAGLLLDRDGVLHGTTVFFNTNLVSTVFRIKPDGSGYALSHVCYSRSDGTSIYGQLIQATDGAIYGTATSGGANTNGGTVFRLTQTPPTLHAVAETNNSLNLTWDAEPGVTYQLQYVSSAAATNWSNPGSGIAATNTTATFTDVLGTNSPRFYRLLVTS
jgi:uncharacterized repeat protein (TIGR03803 family)